MVNDKQENPFVCNSKLARLHNFNLFGGIILWTVIAVAFCIWSFNRMDELIFDAAKIQARTSIEKDIIYRRWNAMHGGIYAPASDILPPNPYLDAESRELITRDGLKLTKVNPAYMTRQVHDLGETVSGLVGHITSLNPIRPENRADEWESNALRQLEKNRHPEATGVQFIDGKEFLRMMISLVIEEGCLKCHAKQGYKVGEIRGGISVTVPLAPIRAAEAGNRHIFMVVNVVAWGLGCLIIFSISRIKLAEIESRENEKRYLNLLETMSEGMVSLDGESNIVFCNSHFAHMLGYSKEELYGLKFDSLMDDDSNAEFMRMTNAGVRGKLDSFEILLKKKNDSLISVLFSSRTLRSVECDFRGLLGVATDISKHKKMELEVQRQQRMSSVGMLAGGVANEVGAPLQYLEVNSAFLRRSFESLRKYFNDLSMEPERQSENPADQVGRRNNEIKGMLDEIGAVLNENDSSILRIADITSSIKDLAGAGEVSSEPESLNALIRQCVEITRSSWTGVAKLDLELSQEIPEIDCIARDINQVLITVIMNAVDAIRALNEEQGVESTGVIRIASGRLGGEVRIVISDNGIGINGDDITRIFEPFFTTKKPGKGTGQGLAVAQRIMNDHKGSIRAENLTGRGTVFVISLPYVV